MTNSALALVMAGMLLSCNPKKAPSEDKPSQPTSLMPIQGPINYLALGDSTGVGVGARNGGYVVRIFNRVLAARPGSKLLNLCVSGATASDVLEGQLERGLSSDPNLITVGVGINDIGHGFSVEEFAQNYEKIISTLKDETKARIIVTNIPDISSAPRIPEFARSEYQRAIIAFNQRLEAIAARYDVTVFDVYSTTREQLPAHPEFFSDDGFHPSDAGYELWAEEMWPVIQRAIGFGLED
ncbi:MAG TPA: SGNH/GDSL hydrolase family protein [Pyrinomonadaceae bacterium]|nr:SGNH/GDSL hydrolase family protein [Pyrinomonadaceae bacterium]